MYNPRGLALRITALVFLGVAGLTLVIRVLTRAAVARSIWAEDVLIILAMVAATYNVVLILQQIEYGVGLHYWDFQFINLSNEHKIVWATMLTYAMSIHLTKISVVLQYHRVFVDLFSQVANVVLSTLVISSFVAFTVANVLICTPPAYFWNHYITNGSCTRANVIWVACNAVSIFLDVLIILLPQPALWNLDLSHMRKLGLSMLFGIGVFTIATSATRMYYLHIYISDIDETYSFADLARWTVIEINTSIICACLITIRPFFSLLLPRLFRWRSRHPPTPAPQLPSLGLGRSGDETLEKLAGTHHALRPGETPVESRWAGMSEAAITAAQREACVRERDVERDVLPWGSFGPEGAHGRARRQAQAISASAATSGSSTDRKTMGQPPV